MADTASTDDNKEKVDLPVDGDLEEPAEDQPEIVKTPEELEKLRAAVFEVAMAKRGQGQDEEEAKAISNALTEDTLKAVEALGLEVPFEYLSDIQKLLSAISAKDGARITLTDDATRIIHSVTDPRNLYAQLADLPRLSIDREKTEAPSEEELGEIVNLAQKVLAGKSAEGGPLTKVEEFERIIFDMNEVREGKLPEEEIPADSIESMLVDRIAELIESGRAGTADGVQSITTEAIIPQYLKGKKSTAPWHKVSREMQTQIRVGMHAAAKHFPESQVKIDDFGGEDKNDVGPIITLLEGDKK